MVSSRNLVKEVRPVPGDTARPVPVHPGHPCCLCRPSCHVYPVGPVRTRETHHLSDNPRMPFGDFRDVQVRPGIILLDYALTFDRSVHKCLDGKREGRNESVSRSGGAKPDDNDRQARSQKQKNENRSTVLIIAVIRVIYCRIAGDDIFFFVGLDPIETSSASTRDATMLSSPLRSSSASNISSKTLFASLVTMHFHGTVVAAYTYIHIHNVQICMYAQSLLRSREEPYGSWCRKGHVRGQL